LKLSRELKTGVAALIIIALFFWGYNYMKGQNLFNGASKTYFATYNNVQGLTTASPVTINGLSVGKVVNITFSDNQNNKGELKVEYSVDTPLKFTKNSTAKIYSTSLMGGKALAVVPSFEGEKAVPGDYLQSEIESDILASVTDQLNPLQAKLESVIVNADSLMLSLNQVLDKESRKNLRYSIAQLTGITSNFNKASKSLNQLLDSNQEKFNATISNTQKMTADFSNLSGKLSKLDIDATMHKLETTLSNFNNILKGMKDGNGTIGKLLNDEAMYRNLTNASKEMEELLREMKEHPKRFVHFSLFGKKDKQGYVKDTLN